MSRPGVGSVDHAPIPLRSVDFQLLGPVEARLEGKTLALGAPKQRAVLAMLALHLGRTVSTDRLAEGLWGDLPPSSAPKMVQLYVSHLRRLLEGNGAEIVTRGHGYELRVVDGEVDVARFECLLEEGRARDALALWRGDALADLVHEPFAAAEIRRLDGLRLQAVERAVDADLAAGRHEDVLGELEALVAEHPLHERLHAQRMLALYRCDRQADALAAYRDARAFLVDQIGVEPGVELRRLHAAILAQDPSLDVAAALPTPPAANHSTATRRRARQHARWAVPTAALLMLAGLVAFAISRATGPDGLGGIDENSVGLIGSSRDRFTAQYAVGRGPGAVVAGLGSVWVANTLDGTVSRVDRQRRQVVTIDVRGAPAALALGAGSLWVADGDARSVAQVDPGTNKVVQRIDVVNAPNAVAYADGALWVASGVDGTLDRVGIDRAPGKRAIAVGSNPTAIAAGAGALWVASEEAGTVSRIDPRSGTVVRAINVGNGPSAIAVGEGAVWVISRTAGTLSRIDAVTNAVSWAVRVGREPAGVAAGAGAVWVAGGGQRAIVRVDPHRPRVLGSVTARSSPSAVAVTKDGVWATGVAPAATHRGHTLRVLVPAAPGYLTLDWTDARSYNPQTFQVSSLLYDGLVGYRRVAGVAGATLVGTLATTAPAPSPDGRSYLFTLRRGARYSNGRPVQPEDFRASMERFLRITRGRFPPYYAAILGAHRCVAKPAQCDLSAGIETDARTRTITVHLTHRDGDFLHKLTVPFAYVVPSATPSRPSGDRLPPGTGPYQLASWDSRSGGLLVRNAHFRSWAAAARPGGFADRIEISVRREQDVEAQVAAVRRGTADVTVLADAFRSRVGPARLGELTTSSPGQVHSVPAASTNWMFLNVRRRPFDDARVRRAVNYATDRGRLAEIAGGRELARPTCQILPGGFPGYEAYCPYTAHPGRARGWTAPDLERARGLVAKSGRAGTRVVVWSPDSQRQTGGYFATLLRDLGFRATLHVIPEDRYFERLNSVRSAPQIGFYGWAADYVSPSAFIQPPFACNATKAPGTVNVSRLCSRPLDRRVARALAARAPDAGAAWASADRRVVDLAPVVPLVNPRAVLFVSRRVGNVQSHLQWSILLDQLWVR